MAEDQIDDLEDVPGGWIKLHRSIIKSRVWLNPVDLKIWIWCLFRANWRPTKIYGQQLQPGQFITSTLKGPEECDIPRTTWRRAMDRLENWGNIKKSRHEVATRFMVVTVCNWETYQCEDPEDGHEVATNRPRTGHEPATNRPQSKKGRIKEGKKGTNTYSAEFEKFWLAFPRGRRKSKQAAAKAFAKALDLTDAETLQRAAAEYAASDEGQGEFVKMPSTWLNQGCWEDDRAAWRRNGANGAKSKTTDRNWVEERLRERARTRDFH